MKKEVSPLAKAYGKFSAVLFATVTFSFFVNLLMFVGPLYMLQIYDRVLASRNETTLIMISAISIGLLVTYGFLEFIRSRMLVQAGLQFDNALASPLFFRVVRMQLLQPGSGGRTALGDSDKVRDFITGQGILAFFDAPWTPLFLALCFSFHFNLGVVATGGAIIIFTLAILNEILTRKSLQEAGSSGQEASYFAGAALQNAEVIRAMGMENQLAQRWILQRDKMLKKQAVASNRAGIIMSSSKFVRMGLQIAILGTGAYLAMKQEISPGIMIAASIVMGRALAPVEQAVGQWKQFVAARQANTRLKSLFSKIPPETERTLLPTPQGNILAQGVSSLMPGTRSLMLRDISFDVAPGEVLAVVGPSGCGKTSLIRLLAGVGQPTSGAIRIDGTKLEDWDPKQIGASRGYLSQDVKLFAGTVAENIARFEEDASDEDIVAAAKLAGAYDMVQGLRDGYGTQVGDGGNQLSGGQRQRIGLARAVYKAPSMIILDEPNSNLDSEGEEALARCLVQLKEMGKTVVVVTHKANLLSVSDKTLILNNGLVQKFGFTKELFQPQVPAPTAPSVVNAPR